MPEAITHPTVPQMRHGWQRCGKMPVLRRQVRQIAVITRLCNFKQLRQAQLIQFLNLFFQIRKGDLAQCQLCSKLLRGCIEIGLQFIDPFRFFLC